MASKNFLAQGDVSCETRQLHCVQLLYSALLTHTNPTHGADAGMSWVVSCILLSAPEAMQQHPTASSSTRRGGKKVPSCNVPCMCWSASIALFPCNKLQCLRQPILLTFHACVRQIGKCLMSAAHPPARPTLPWLPS